MFFIRHFLRRNSDQRSKKSQSGPIQGSVRIRYSDVGCTIVHREIIYIGYSLYVSLRPFLITICTAVPLSQNTGARDIPTVT